MNVQGLLGSLIGGALSSRRKRHAGAERFLTGGRSSFLNASTLLGAAALGWAGYEVWRSRSGPSKMRAETTAPPTVGGSASSGVPPPIPPAAANDGLARLAGLLISAARADGELGEEEYGRILHEARARGADQHVMAELAQPRPLVEIVGLVRDPQLKSDLYVLAFTIVAADEDVSAAERLWLADLARQLGIDAIAIERLEHETQQRIRTSL